MFITLYSTSNNFGIYATNIIHAQDISEQPLLTKYAMDNRNSHCLISAIIIQLSLKNTANHLSPRDKIHLFEKVTSALYNIKSIVCVSGAKKAYN